MTRPRADAEPWLTDMVSRDREIAKTVVYGIRNIQSLLRAIRDELAETKALRAELRETRQEIRDLWEELNADRLPPTAYTRPTDRWDFPRCENERCVLPDGHTGNHRASLRAVGSG